MFTSLSLPKALSIAITCLSLNGLAHANAEAGMRARSGEHMAGSKMPKERLEGAVSSRLLHFIKDNTKTPPMVNIGLLLRPFNTTQTLCSGTLSLCVFAVAV